MAEEKEILLRIEVDKTQVQKNLDNVTDQLIENKKAIDTLNQSYKDGNKSTNAYIQESVKLKEEQKKLGAEQRNLVKELNAESNSINALRSKLSELTKERNNTNQQTAEGSKRFRELQKEIGETTDALKAQEGAGGDFRRNVGNYTNSVKDAIGQVNIFGVSLKDLFTTLLTNPIGIAVAAFTALFQALKQNDEIATFFKGVMTGLGVVLDKVTGFIADGVLGLVEFMNSGSAVSTFIKDTLVRSFNAVTAPLQLIIDLMPAVGKALKGEFSEATNLATEAGEKFAKNISLQNKELPELIKNLGGVVDVGIEYEKQLDAIESKQSKLNVTNAQAENQRDKLLLQSRDLSKSEEDRIKLIEQAEAIDKKKPMKCYLMHKQKEAINRKN
jgi:hypothetical protein